MHGIDGWPGQRPRLAVFADAADRFLLLLVAVSAALGIAFPGPGRRVDDGGCDPGHAGSPGVLHGCVPTFTEIAASRTSSRRLILVLAVTTITLPALAWLASQLVSGPVLRGGVLAAGVAPAEVASVALTGLAGGEVAVAAGLLVASTLLTVLLAGPILSLLGASSTSQLGLLLTLALVVALPLAAGSAMRTLDPFGGREQSLVRIVGTASLLVLLWGVASELQRQASDVRVVAALLVYLAGASVLGWLLAAGVPPRRRTAIVLATAMRDFAVAAGSPPARSGRPRPRPWASTGFWCWYSALSLFPRSGDADDAWSRHRSLRVALPGESRLDGLQERPCPAYQGHV